MGEKNILALDYGLRYVGVAVSQRGKTPQPLTTLDGRNIFKLREKILKLIEDYEIDLVLIGGGDKEGARKLVKVLQTKTKGLLPSWKVSLKIVDEYLTSHQAEWELVREEGSLIDEHARAAQLMIRDYLEG